MKKKLICLAVLFIAVASVVSAADQLFFELTGGTSFYPAIGGKIGWMHYWNNEKIGLITDVSYFNNGFVHEPEGDWREWTKKAHNIGIAAGMVFNNMGMNGLIRTMEYIKLKVLLRSWDGITFYPCLDAGFKLNVFFTDKTAFSTGVGTDLPLMAFPHFYLSLGMVFTL